MYIALSILQKWCQVIIPLCGIINSSGLSKVHHFFRYRIKLRFQHRQEKLFASNVNMINRGKSTDKTCNNCHIVYFIHPNL